MNYKFTTNILNRTDELINYLLGPRLWIPKVDYPDFDNWINKVYLQLKSEEKRAIVCISSGAIVGAIVYQHHRSVEDALEIKNITVRPDQQGHYIASFLMRNAEFEGTQDFKTKKILVDSKSRNMEIRSFLFKNGYTPLCVIDLYDLGSGDDMIYAKLSKKASESIIRDPI